ncbi:MAG: hypothetical protein U0941_30730 [Planctomycetaceae bacterium]
MSTEYFIFVDSDDIEEVLRIISTVDGVAFYEKQIQINGMLFTGFEELNESSRKIMREHYGEYGLKVNCRIWGTYDKSHDSDELLMRLFRCVVSIIKAWPERNVSLMRNAESFYVINNSGEVMISPVLTHDHAAVSLVNELALIKKTTICRSM